MKVYSISYDLAEPGRQYSQLHEGIKSLGSWAHPLDSMWMIYTSLDADQIYERLNRHLDSNDEILVLEAGRNYSGYLNKQVWTWLGSHAHGVLN